jgi:hypothetical protein
MFFPRVSLGLNSSAYASHMAGMTGACATIPSQDLNFSIDTFYVTLSFEA